MMNKRLLTHCCLLILALPTCALALNESENISVAQTESVNTAPAKPAPVQPLPEKPIPAPTTPVITAPAPAQSAPVKSNTIQPAPAKPNTAHPAPAKPAPVKPAPPQTAPAKPAPLTPITPPVTRHVPVKPIPAKPGSAVQAAKPAPAASSPAAQEKPSPKQAAPDVVTPDTAAPLTQANDIEFFIREDCLQCDKAKEFLGKLHSLQPQLKMATRDVRKEPAALELLKRMAQSQGNLNLDYPAFIVGGQLIIGFSEEASTAQLILDTLAVSHPGDAQASADAATCTTGKEPSCGLIPPAPAPKPESTTINILGYNIPILLISMPVLTLTMGILDGFNYGSTWVLILMVSLLAPLKNRSLMLTIAGTFIAVQGIIYFAVMAAWFNLSLLIDINRTSQIVFATIALLVAAIYFKNYLQHGQSLSISSPEISKPGIYTRIRKIVESENIVIALSGVIVLAILVQISELTYKSAFPALYTRLLMLQHLDKLSNYAYLLLYDFSYMLDHVVVLVVGILTLKHRPLQDSKGSMLKLISAVLLTGAGLYLLLINT